jgi:hypothetical protein
MLRSKEISLLTGSMMDLFCTKIPNLTRINHKDQYYKNDYFSQKLSEGVELIAKIENLTKKDAASMLMQRGLSSYMGDKLTEHIKNEQLAREQNIPVLKTRFIQMFNRYAETKGFKTKDTVKDTYCHPK